eukprot:CAMPEP_0194522286 /NCGR_PEP_ID=MMETSP0253-20130528/56828_1 /TAXON_ID=2966 /ORGANISM="Noctiluca scintillans" /LENGTH=37 /DNA_ID= /DNA_START= /DNA_END= /DNA_ORIENTATION=
MTSFPPFLCHNGGRNEFEVCGTLRVSVLLVEALFKVP